MSIFRDLGENGNDALILDWAFADYRWRDFLGVRIGKVKAAFGYYNAIRDFDVLRTGVFAPQSVYPELLRDTYSFIKGLSLYGYKSVGPLGNFSYSYSIGLLNVSTASAYKNAVEDFWSLYNLRIDEMGVDLSHFWECQWETPVPGLVVGGTYYYTDDLYFTGNTGGKDPAIDAYFQIDYFREYMDIYGYFLLLRYSFYNAVFMTEFWRNTIEGLIDVDKPVGDRGFLPTTDLINQGWYASLSYRFHERFEAEYSYSVQYPDMDNKDGHALFKPSPAGIHMKYAGWPKIFNGYDFEAWKKTSTFSFRFDLNAFWLVKIEASYNDGFGDYTFTGNPDGLHRYWWLYAAKVTYSF